MGRPQYTRFVTYSSDGATLLTLSSGHVVLLFYIKVMSLILAFIARRRGLEETIERLLDPETHPSAQTGLGRLPENVMRSI